MENVIIAFIVAQLLSTAYGLAVIGSVKPIIEKKIKDQGYVLKNKVLHKITKEHTLVNFLVETGELTPEEAINHPKKNVLMKALGASEKQELDIFDVDPNVDAILLVTDGLTNMLTMDQVEKVLNDEELKYEDKLIKLIRKCNARGGTDNISIAYLVKDSDISDN